MWCPQCGADNEESARFCNQCGFDYTKYRGQWQTTGGDPAAAQTPPGSASEPQSYGATGFDTSAYGYQQTDVEPNAVDKYEAAYEYARMRPVSVPVPPPKVPDYLGWSIAVLLLCFWPTGIIAIVYSSRVNSRLAMGDYEGAWESSRKAKMWCWLSLAIVIVLWFVVFATAIAAR